jgi:hypothetical protein
VAIAFAALALPGVPMGVPFAAGIRLIAPRPALVAWAWAINGCASVLSAVGATLAGLQWGFPPVLIASAAAYALAGALAPRLGTPGGPPPAREAPSCTAQIGCRHRRTSKE